MSTAYMIQGDTRAVLAELAAAGIVVDLVLCSPAFLEQREYLPADHPDKALEMGREDTPGAFIDGLLDVTEACDQVLAPHGSIAIELGDTSSGSGGSGGDYAEGGWRDGQPRYDGTAAKARRVGDYPVRDDYPRPARDRLRKTPDGWPAEKSLCMTPELYRVALAYGFNPLTGRTTRRWRVRNVIDWGRTNPSPGRDGDKFRRASSDLVIACRTDENGRRRYWDGDAVRTPHKDPSAPSRPHPRSASRSSYPGGGGDTDAADADRGYHGHRGNPAGAPLLDWWATDEFDPDLWVVNSGGGYTGAHYATWPPKLVEPLIKAMCPERVCTVCGEPSWRIPEVEPSPYTGGETERDRQSRGRIAEARNGERRITPVTGTTHAGVARRAETLGWTSCGHDAWRPGIVLDPFGGSGTTGAVATGHGRDALLIDLDERNIELARERVGGLFFHETTVDGLAEVLGPRAAIGGAA